VGSCRSFSPTVMTMRFHPIMDGQGRRARHGDLDPFGMNLVAVSEGALCDQDADLSLCQVVFLVFPSGSDRLRRQVHVRYGVLPTASAGTLLTSVFRPGRPTFSSPDRNRGMSPR